MNILEQTSLHLLADTANSMWHEATVFGIGIASFAIIMVYAVKGDLGRRSHHDRSPGDPTH